MDWRKSLQTRNRFINAKFPFLIINRVLLLLLFGVFWRGDFYFHPINVNQYTSQSIRCVHITSSFPVFSSFRSCFTNRLNFQWISNCGNSTSQIVRVYHTEHLFDRTVSLETGTKTKRSSNSGARSKLAADSKSDGEWRNHADSWVGAQSPDHVHELWWKAYSGTHTHTAHTLLHIVIIIIPPTQRTNVFECMFT